MVNDSVKLLKECDSGTKYAIIGIVEVIEKVCSEEFRNVLKNWVDKYNEMGEKIRGYLEERCDSCGKTPSKMAISMIKGVIVLRTMDASDAKIAAILAQSGVAAEKKLNKYLKEFCEANEESVVIAKELISLQRDFTTELEKFGESSCD